MTVFQKLHIVVLLHYSL